MLRPTHFQIPVDDTARAMKFYGEIFGWKFQPFGTDDHHFVDTGSDEIGINGTIFKRKHPSDPMTNSIEVPSIDEYCTKIASNGGTVVVPKTAVPTMGYLAYFKDPEGNVHGLWQNDPEAT